MKTRPIAAALAAPLAALLLAACGTTEASTGDTGTSEAADAGPITLTDSFDRTVELDGPAERVAVVEWQQLEDVLTLGVEPVAVADAEGFATWNSAAELPEGVVDVGLRHEPNLETLFKAEPDLVIVEAYTAEDDIIKQLEEYDVPVLATKGADAKDPIANMIEVFELIARATGREDEAAPVVEEFNTSLEEAKAAVADADLESREFVYYDGWIDGGNVAIRPFGQGSLVGELGEELGLENAWKGDVDAAYGLGQTDIEGMSEVGDATLFYTGTSDPSGDVNAELAKNPLWKSLPAVEDGRAYAFPAGIWTFGGPRSSQQVLDAYVDALTQ